MSLDIEAVLRKARREYPEKEASNGVPINTLNKAKMWQAPVYSQSRGVQLDLDLLAANRCICALPDTPESDYYRVLRTQIQQIATAKGWKTLMVTSTQPGEGKTLTSINLAFSFARAYHQTVLLVDCDYRRQCIHKYLGLSGEMGLIETLLDGVPVNEVIVWPGVEKMALISGGRTISDSAELLSSPMMKTLVLEMRNRYLDRFVFFDLPPILGGADAMAFANLVDGVVLVVGAGEVAKKDLYSALSAIPEEKLVGIVVNKETGRMPNYYTHHRGDGQ
ncbi:MAG: AAA family ATPase [Desulfosarcinaceae bacterium]|nr:AAA family ATPase [Desulfosarcinaceae bacterium]